MRAKTIVTQVTKYGRLPQKVLYEIECYAARTIGKQISITIGAVTNKRSNQQCRFYFGIVVPMIKEMFEEAGNVVDSDDVHCFLRAHVGKLVNRVVSPDGTTKNVLKSSTKLTTMEFEDYLTKIRAWAAEQGVIIPLPNESEGL